MSPACFSNNRAWSPSIHAVLLLLLVVSGCRTSSQRPSGSGTNDANGPRADAAAQSRDSQPTHHRSRRGQADTKAAPGEFDFFLLNLSWSPEFCATHSNGPECGHGLGFVVHGLWPQDISGAYPENCSDAPGPANPNAYTDIFPTASLVEHEWKTHGTCSGLSQDTYFAAIRRAYAAIRIPLDIGAHSDSALISPEQLLQRFAKENPNYPAGSFAISCGNNRLTEVEVCLTKDFQPEGCQNVRSCRAKVIRVSSK